MLKLTKQLSVFILTFALIGLSSQILTESTWFTSSLSYIFTTNNFHEVKKGELFRSGELSKEDLERTIKEHGIKTIIDLRKGGDEPEQKGFSEKVISTDLGAKYIWIPMVGSNTKQKENLKKLIEVSKEGAGPVLIHCASGTHRSGLSTAVWLMAKDGINPHEAARQLSSKYGYFKWERDLKSYIMGHNTIDYVMWDYLKDYDKTSISFNDWLENHSDPL